MTGTAVDVVNIAFKPASVQVSPGDTVTWSSADAGVAHTVTSGRPGSDAVPGVSEATPARPDGAFDGPLGDSGSTFSHRFDEPGAYAYFCAVHPSMTGEVVVR